MIHRFAQRNDTAGAKLTSHRSDVEQHNPLIQLHDPESKDHGLTGSLSVEIINVSGAEVVVYIRTDHSGFDEVFEEDPDPTYYSGKRIKAFFVPQPKKTELLEYGIDTPNKAEIVFSRVQVVELFGSRMIRAGDIIEIPYNAKQIKLDRYRVLNAFDSGNFKYEWYYWTCEVENIPSDKVLDIDHK